MNRLVDESLLIKSYDHSLFSVIGSSSHRCFLKSPLGIMPISSLIPEFMPESLLRTAADVILWRRKNAARGILLVTLASWVMFERTGYTLLSLVSSVLLLLTTILFLWAKSAALLNRPAPPLPNLHITEETTTYLASLGRTYVNAILSAFQNIALGRDSKMFFRVAGWLLLISVIARLTDFLTLGYTTLFLIFTMPVLYERCEVRVEKWIVIAYSILQQLYVKLDKQYFSLIHRLTAGVEDYEMMRTLTFSHGWVEDTYNRTRSWLHTTLTL
ncbi:hypothetical protein SAY86_001305 [Trapa natans]|uniref:Reticulon-like protein n=1 Tax=Trapa natans TaxID=22666 RepID=A0AAN7RGD2_TRANT|nr:hypothetical protein SAY86_001305 [Trapa natans]